MLGLVTDLFPCRKAIFLVLVTLLACYPLVCLSQGCSIFPKLSMLVCVVPYNVFFGRDFGVTERSVNVMCVLLTTITLRGGGERLDCKLALLTFFFRPFMVFFIFVFFLVGEPFAGGFMEYLLLVAVVLKLYKALANVSSVLGSVTTVFTNSSDSLLLGFAGCNGNCSVRSNFSLIKRLDRVLPVITLY